MAGSNVPPLGQSLRALLKGPQRAALVAGEQLAFMSAYALNA